MSAGTHPMHTRAPIVAGGADNDPATRHYRVFISYSHTDATWANGLMRKLLKPAVSSQPYWSRH